MTLQSTRSLADKLNVMGLEVRDVDEGQSSTDGHTLPIVVSLLGCEPLETYDLFSRDLPESNLGMIDDKSSTLQVEVAGIQYEIRQSPGLLTSSHAEGTTGAALWKISPCIARWLTDHDNLLWSNSILHTDAVLVELGCGISGLIGCVLSRQVYRYVLTDQKSVMKLLRENITANAPSPSSTKVKGRMSRKQHDLAQAASNICALELNWETDDVDVLAEAVGPDQAIDLVLVCDCVFNDFLLEPLVSMCEKLCSRSPDKNTVLLVAQQLRSDEIFSAFMGLLCRHFNVWRLPDSSLPITLQSSSGFAIHLAILQENK